MVAAISSVGDSVAIFQRWSPDASAILGGAWTGSGVCMLLQSQTGCIDHVSGLCRSIGEQRKAHMKDADWRFNLLYPFRVWEDVEPGREIPPTRPDLPQFCKCMISVLKIAKSLDGTMSICPVPKPICPVYGFQATPHKMVLLPPKHCSLQQIPITVNLSVC